MHCLLAGLLLAALPFNAYAQAPFGQSEAIRRVADELAARGVQVSLYAVADSAPGAPLSIHGAETSPPASVLKILSSGAALMALGPEFRFNTRLYATRDPEDGRLQATLVLVGDGDPSLTGRWERGNPNAVFERWADQLRGRGLHSVTGDLIADDDLFDDTPTAPGWTDYTPTDWYTAEVSALSFNDNCIDIRVTPPRELEGHVRLTLSPVTEYVSVSLSGLRVRPNKSGWSMAIERTPGTNQNRLTGWAPAGGSARSDYITVVNASLYTATVLREVFARKGITLEGGVHDIDEPRLADWKRPDGRIPAGWVQMASHTSPPLRDLLIPVNQRSQNLYAELLLKRLGVERAGEGSFEQGANVALQIWRQAGLDVSDLRMVDGSGLSRLNRISPRAMVEALRIIQRHPDGDVFMRSLALAGQEGTLQNRFGNPPLRGKLRGKTGYLNGTRTLAGTGVNVNGETVTFAIFLQGETGPVRAATERMDRMVDLLYR